MRLKLCDFFRGREELEKDFSAADLYLIYNFTLPDWTTNANPYSEPITYEQIARSNITNGLTSHADGRSIRMYKALPVKVEFNGVTKVVEVKRNECSPLGDLFKKVRRVFELEHNVYLLNEEGEYYSRDDKIPNKLLKEVPNVVSIKEYIKVLVRFKNDVTIAFIVHPDKSYADVVMLKEQICALSDEKIETNDFRAVLSGRKLEDGKLLHEYGYKKDRIVHVMLPPKYLSEEKVNKHIESVKIFEDQRKVSQQIISSTDAMDIDQPAQGIK